MVSNRKNVKYLPISILLLICLFCVSCTQRGNGNVNARLFTDSCGREVMLPREITRVAVSGPIAQIAVYAFAPECLAGLSTVWPEAAKEFIPEEYAGLPVMGQLYGGKGELNQEELLKVSPQVVIDIGEAKASTSEDLDRLGERLGIPFVHIDAEPEDPEETFSKLGELLNLEERAAGYCTYLERLTARHRAVMERVGGNTKSLLYCMGDTGCNVISKGAYHGRIIDMTADNSAVMEDVTALGSGVQVDLEQIMLWDPDVIIFAPDSIYEQVSSMKGWQQLRAIKEGQYYRVPDGPYNWLGFPPSLQRYLGMLWLPVVLYPEYCEYDLHTEISEFYKMFFHCELTDAQYERITAGAL